MRKHQFSIYLSIAVLFAIWAILSIFSSGSSGFAGVISYGQAFLRALNSSLLKLILLSFCGGLLLIGIIIFCRSALRGDDIRAVWRRFSARSAGRGIWEFIKSITPFMIGFILLSLIVGSASALYRNQLIDERVASWDHALFGAFPFFLSGAAQFPGWLTAFIVFSYLYLVPAMFVAVVLFFWMNREVFYEFCAAFSWGSLLMVAGWLLVPVLTPQDRFLDNVYHLPISSHLALAVQSFHPPAAVAHFLDAFFSHSKEVAIISSFPSAHVVWAVLVAYGMFRVNRKLGFVTLPFFVAASFGTFFLAQHYAVDALAALPVAAVAIVLARTVSL